MRDLYSNDLDGAAGYSRHNDCDCDNRVSLADVLDNDEDGEGGDE
jgi:hypothetical protein